MFGENSVCGVKATEGWIYLHPDDCLTDPVICGEMKHDMSDLRNHRSLVASSCRVLFGQVRDELGSVPDSPTTPDAILAPNETRPQKFFPLVRLQIPRRDAASRSLFMRNNRMN